MEFRAKNTEFYSRKKLIFISFDIKKGRGNRKGEEGKKKKEREIKRRMGH